MRFPLTKGARGIFSNERAGFFDQLHLFTHHLYLLPTHLHLDMPSYGFEYLVDGFKLRFGPFR